MAGRLSRARADRRPGGRLLGGAVAVRGRHPRDRRVLLVAGRPDAIEPDGQPNEKNIPTSTLKTNIYYHLGLAHYLKGDFAAAADAYRLCMEHSKNPDMQVATAHWQYMTFRRMAREDEAARVLLPITGDMPVIENASYHTLFMM